MGLSLGHALSYASMTLTPPGGGVTPASFAGLEAWYDPSDITTLFQDAARTIPITADGQTVGGIADKSGKGQHLQQGNITQRPVYRMIGGIASLQFDGVDDVMFVLNALSLSTEYSHCIALRKLADASQSFAYFLGTTLQLRTSTAAGSGAYLSRLGIGASLSNIQSASLPAPETAILTQAGRMSPTPSHKFRRNGVGLGVDTAGQGAGAYGTNMSYFLGAVSGIGGGSLPGHVYGDAIYSVELPDSAILALERYFGTKAGLTF